MAASCSPAKARRSSVQAAPQMPHIVCASDDWSTQEGPRGPSRLPDQLSFPGRHPARANLLCGVHTEIEKLGVPLHFAGLSTTRAIWIRVFLEENLLFLFL